MSKEMKNMMVPRLRFPEFLETEEWEEKTLGSISQKISDGIHTTPNYDENGEVFFVNGNNLTDGKIVVSSSTKRVSLLEYEKYKIQLGDNSILMSINGTIGNLAFYQNEKIVLGKSACYINLSTPHNKVFVFNLLQTDRIKSFLKEELTGSTIMNLSLASVKKLRLLLPSFQEQQKIADCLSSFNDLIAAQSQKLDALKTHKKGLMQQLFPADGEMVPRLRFPEFGGDWEEKTLGYFLEFKNGINASKEQYGKGIKFINVLDILNNNYITYDKIIGSVDITENEFLNYVVSYGDIVFQRSSETQEEVGVANVYLDQNKNAAFGGFVIRGQKIKEYVPLFMNFLLKTDNARHEITSKSGGSTRYNIGQETLRGVKILTPSLPEQQKIADCLSSLDDLITAQNQKLDALKIHKKGLMQQLFPNP